jgi:hypothetical protein
MTDIEQQQAYRAALDRAKNPGTYWFGRVPIDKRGDAVQERDKIIPKHARMVR